MQPLGRQPRTGDVSSPRLVHTTAPRGRRRVARGAGAGAVSCGSTVTELTPSGSESARSTGSASLFHAWPSPSTTVSRRAMVKPMAVRTPSGVRMKRSWCPPAEPSRTGTNSGPAGVGSSPPGSLAPSPAARASERSCAPPLSLRARSGAANVDLAIVPRAAAGHLTVSGPADSWAAWLSRSCSRCGSPLARGQSQHCRRSGPGTRRRRQRPLTGPRPLLSRRMARLLSSGAAEDRNLGSEAVYARIERVAVALPGCRGSQRRHPGQRLGPPRRGGRPPGRPRIAGTAPLLRTRPPSRPLT